MMAVPTFAVPATLASRAAAAFLAALPVLAANAALAAEDAHGETHGGGFLSAELLLLLALIVLAAIVWKPAKRAVLVGLDSRAERIKNELDEAARLREEAQTALANFKRRQRDALSEAEEILSHARQDAERLRASAAAELETVLKRREQMALDRITQAEQAATAEVRNAAVDVALAASRQIIAQQLDRDRSNALIEAAIEDLPRRLN